jgi:hypothetical protein
MPLALAVFAGFLAGSLRAGFQKKPLQVPMLTHSWIIIAALIPQILVFQFPKTGQVIALVWAKGILVSSLCCLLAFVWLNRKLPGLKFLGIGLGLNLLVILVNGGLMPIKPENASYVHPDTAPEAWPRGERLGTGKDVVLSPAEMRLDFLSDWFRFPSWSPYRVAYSLGDIFIAVGTFWLLWSAGKPASLQAPTREQ